MDNDFPPIDKEDYKPLYAQLGDAIIQYIQKKNLKPGDPIPSETDLVKYYGVSRMTVRQAIQRVATEGIIQKIQGKGTFIAESKLSEQIRSAKSLEENFAELGIQINNILLDSSVAHPTHYYLQALNLPPGSKTYKISRLKMIDGKPFCIEIRNIPIHISERFTLTDLNNTPSIDLLNRDPETEVHHIDFQVRGAVLLEREAELMHMPVDTPVLIQFMTHYNSIREPVMTGRLTFLAEKIEIAFEYHKNGRDKRKLMIK